MLLSHSGIFAKAISIAFTSLLQRKSISLASFLQCLHFRSSRLELLYKKWCSYKFRKAHRCFIWCRCFLCILLNFKENLFSQSTSSGCFWHLHQLRFSVLILYIINRHPRRENVQFLFYLQIMVFIRKNKSGVSHLNQI